MRMFEAGNQHHERAALGGNRVGKSTGIGGYETALHLTGLYPDWWPGHVFDKQIESWACGKTSVKTRDVNQAILLGGIIREESSGLIPRARVKRFTRKSGVSEAIDTVVIKHKSGWENKLVFKSYEEGRQSFEGEEKDWIWFDEEPKREIYDEGRMRTLTTNGHILSTFTPLDGITDTVLAMLEGTDLL